MRNHASRGLGGRQSLLASGGLTLAAGVWAAALALVTVPLMVHGLGADEYGIYSLAFSVAALGSYLDLGLGWTTAKFVAEADATARARLGTVIAAAALYHLCLGTMFAIAIGVSAPWISRFLLQVAPDHIHTAVRVLQITALSFVASSLMGVFVSALRGLRRFTAATAIATGSATLSVAGAALTASMGLGLIAAAAAQFCGAIVGMMAGFAACAAHLRNAERGRPLLRELRAMLGFSSWNYGTRLIQMLMLQFDKILLARWLGPAAVTFYAVPFNFAQRVGLLGGPAVTAIYPVAAGSAADRDGFLRQYLAASRLLHVTTAAIAIALLAWGDRFLAAWIGAEMAAEGTSTLRILTVGFWAVSVGSFDGGCIEGWNRPRFTFLISTAAATVGVTLVTATVWTRSLTTEAVALGVAGYFVTAGLGQMIVWHRLSRYPLGFMLRRTALPIAEMAVLGAIASPLLRTLAEGRAMTIATLFALIAGLGAYGVWRSMSGIELRTLTMRVMTPWAAA